MPRARRPSTRFKWALRLADPKYAGFIEQRRVWLWEHGEELKAGPYWNDVLQGLAAAQERARIAERRRQRGLLIGRGRDVKPWDDVALIHPQMSGNIELARRALFGDISDRAIRHRLQVFAEQSARAPRYCEMANCTNELPQNARSTRKRCDSCRAVGRRH